MTTRRDFLRGLLSLGATAAAGVALVEPEPVRRFWQVGRGAPVSRLGTFTDHLRQVYGDKIVVYQGDGIEHRYTYDPGVRAFSLADVPSAYDDHAAHIRAHTGALFEAYVRARDSVDPADLPALVPFIPKHASAEHHRRYDFPVFFTLKGDA